MERYESLVIGLGAMGAATVYQLAKAGVKVAGIDRHHPPHSFGSSHGDTRITRLTAPSAITSLAAALCALSAALMCNSPWPSNTAPRCTRARR